MAQLTILGSPIDAVCRRDGHGILAECLPCFPVVLLSFPVLISLLFPFPLDFNLFSFSIFPLDRLSSASFPVYSP